MASKEANKIMKLEAELEEMKSKVIIDLSGKTFKKWKSEQP